MHPPNYALKMRILYSGKKVKKELLLWIGIKEMLPYSEESRPKTIKVFELQYKYIKNKSRQLALKA